MDSHRLNFAIAFLACMAFVALSESALAISLGTSQKADSLAINAGSFASADLLFWSSVGENFTVEIRPESLPEGWHAASVPPVFGVGDAREYPQKENMLLGSAPVVARVVPVVINVPEDETDGTYLVAMKAVAGGSEGQVSLAQERIFTFRVSVLGGQPQAKSNTGRSIDYGSPGIAAANDGMDGAAKENGPNGTGRIAFLVLASIAVVYASWKIYRR